MENLNIYTTNVNIESVGFFLSYYYEVTEQLEEFITPHGYNLTNYLKKYQPQTRISNLSRTYPYLFVDKVISIRGKYHSGTHFQEKDLLSIMLKANIKLQVLADLAMFDIIRNTNVIKIDRKSTITRFHPLTDTIKEIYIPAQDSENKKKFAYSSLLTLVNMMVLGTTAKKYALDNGIEVEKKKTIRDYLNEVQLKKIEKMEEHLNGLIRYARITDYQELKKRIREF